MTTNHRKVSAFLAGLLAERPVEAIAEQMLPSDAELSARLSGATKLDERSVQNRWELLARCLGIQLDDARAELLSERTRSRLDAYSNSIENMIGTVEVPLGLAGPLRVRGVHASDDYFVPLATTEAALVASCTRGAQVLSLAGGCRSAVVNHGVHRAPAFVFRDLTEAGRFAIWVTEHYDKMREQAEATTRHGKLTDVRVNLEGNHVYIICEFTTGEASGQNMVTIATEALCQYIIAHCPMQPVHWFVEGNMSGDKKASAATFLGVRGRKVVAEATLPAHLVERRLHTTVDAMHTYWQVSSLGGVLSGTIGVQGHYANILAAMYIALGQDAACVAESAVGVTRFESDPNGDLYVSVTLPAVMVGTVGGGTGLPSAQSALRLLNLPDEKPADALAEIVGAMALAGEVSIIAALAAGDFTRAHQQLARGRRNPPRPST